MPIIDTTFGDSNSVRVEADTLRASAVESTPNPVSDHVSDHVSEQGGGPDHGDPGAELDAGASVGRYRIIERLGAGGMGVVYRAHDPQLDRDVALKLLRARKGDGRELAERLLREAKSAAKIRHANVVTVYDAGEDQGRVFIAMELMQGTDLGKWFAERRSWREVVGVMLQAAQGLRAAHDAGLVHRDFKPDNVVLERDGNVKVLDFGLARVAYDDETQSRVAGELAERLATTAGDGRASATDADGRAALDRLTRTGALLGTPAYMAPEQYMLEPLDARTDQFSFCVALFVGVYGQRPFGGRTYAELTVNVINGNVEVPATAELAPARLLTVLRKGMARNPADRHPSMDALMRELERVLAQPDSRERGRSRALMVGIGATALAGLAALVVLIDTNSGGGGTSGGSSESVGEVGGDDSGQGASQAAGQGDGDGEPTQALPALELAKGRGRNKPVDGPQITVTRAGLQLRARDGAPPLAIALDADGASEGPLIPALMPALEPLRTSTMASVYDPLTLHVDRRVPFETIVRVMYSAGRAGFARFDFAVMTEGEVRVIEVKPPTMMMSGDVQLRRQLALDLVVHEERLDLGARAWAPDDAELVRAPIRWSLDAGGGTCALPLSSATLASDLAPLTQLSTQLCALEGLSIPAIVAADDQVSWERVVAVVDAAQPNPTCARGVVFEAKLEPADCDAPLSITALREQLEQSTTEPEFRRWCFINSRIRSKKVCRTTQAACVSEARHWVANPKSACKGEP